MSLNAKQEKALLGSSLFSGCSSKSCQTVVQSLSPIRIAKGQEIASFPGQNPALGFMLEGIMDICSMNGVLLSSLESGDFFEIESLFSSVKPLLPIHMRARTNMIVTFLGKNTLLPLLNEDQVIASNYMELLADDVQNLTCRLCTLTAASPSISLALYLLRYSKHNTYRLPDGLAGLARRLNISRATLYRALAKLEKKALVYYREKSIHILDYDRLYRYAYEESQPDASAENAKSADSS